MTGRFGNFFNGNNIPVTRVFTKINTVNKDYQVGLLLVNYRNISFYSGFRNKNGTVLPLSNTMNNIRSYAIIIS